MWGCYNYRFRMTPRCHTIAFFAFAHVPCRTTTLTAAEQQLYSPPVPLLIPLSPFVEVTHGPRVLGETDGEGNGLPRQW
mgnify:FL=1